MLGQPTRVRVVKGADVVELDDVTALVAALERALARDLLLPISIRPCAYLPEQLSVLTVSQLTWWESAGKPVQPAYCSSPAPLTMMGLSRVPIVRTSIYTSSRPHK